MTATLEKPMTAQVYCPICTHTVQAEVQWIGKRIRVHPGQKCARCSAPLDAGAVLEVVKAA
jgi:hypothetical protein